MAAEQPSPAISISLAVEPTSFAVTSDNTSLPNLSLTATSHAAQPITIFTFGTIFNLEFSQLQGHFACVDLTTGQPENVDKNRGPCRFKGPDRTRGSSDEKYFLTLEPGTPVTVTYKFELAYWGLALPQGHCYRLDVSEKEVYSRWWWGRKSDVMLPGSILDWLWLKLVRGRRPQPKASGKPIDISSTVPVEFEILPSQAKPE